MAKNIYSVPKLLFIVILIWANFLRISGQGSFRKSVAAFPINPVPRGSINPGPSFPFPGPSFPQPRPNFPFRPTFPPVGPPVRPPVPPPVRPPTFPPVQPPPVQPPPVGPAPVFPPGITPQFPPPFCDMCNAAQLGLAQLLFINELNVLADDVMKAAEECKEERPAAEASIAEGPERNTDSATLLSQALCPPNNIIVGCKCSEPDPSDCLSVRLRGHRRCVIEVNSATLNKAVALCSSNSDDAFEIVRSPFADNPSATCPEGTSPVDCWFDTRRTDMSERYLTDINSDTRECTSRSSCPAGDRCRLRLLCERDT